jgi:ABC-type sugar transport system ATPase subunit
VQSVIQIQEGAIPIRVRGLTKAFPGVRALREMNLDVLSAEVHGLVGENGAGKSTLVKLIAGVYRPDEGNVELFGRPLQHANPREAQRAGVAVIYQERSIVPELSAAANVFLGRPQTYGPFISRQATARRFKDLAKSLGADINPDARAGSLSVADQQLLEIMRALNLDQRILIMDEPTTALGGPERDRLYAIISDLRRKGLAIIFISHDLAEVLTICDRVTVMRDGELVATRAVDDWSMGSLVAAMLGDASLSSVKRGSVAPGAEVLRVEGLSIPGTIANLTFSLHRGEILGIAGLIGSGRTEILRALAGADRGAQGRFFLDGKERRLPRSINQSLGNGIALAPEDRKAQGLILGLNGVVNVTLANLGATSRYGVIEERKRYEHASEISSGVGFFVERLKAPVGTLSGGNQQKLVISKWLYSRPKILLLDEPTQGIDVGAKAEMFSTISRLAATGMSVIFVSSEFEEVVNMADRVLVIGNGELLGELSGEAASVKHILNLLFNVPGAA